MGLKSSNSLHSKLVSKANTALNFSLSRNCMTACGVGGGKVRGGRDI